MNPYVLAGVGVLAAGAFGVAFVSPSSFSKVSYDAAPDQTVADFYKGDVETVDEREVVTHAPLPEAVKAVYMTSCVAGTPSFRKNLIALIEETELNSVVIDIKDYSGTISFPPESEAWEPAWQDARCGTSGMKALIAELHEKGIFVIGRVTVFQDPFYTQVRPDLAVKKADGETVWQDYKKLSFIDVGAREYWDHIILLAVDSYNIGFDELNFDYVRYPSDGNMQDISFVHTGDGEKQATLESFFKYLNEQLSDPERFASVRHEGVGREEAVPYLSADLFGMTTTNTDDLSIGQIQERAAPYFDFIAPMVYPSHYPKSFLGLGNPNNYPYKVVNYAMAEGARRMAATTTPVAGFLHERIGTTTPAIYEKTAYDIQKLRPWLQDFDYGGDYDAADVRAQIQATYDAGLTSWMMWDPGNIYTRSAYMPAE